MKSQQDALERRMWAKRERIKGEHQKNSQAERDMCVRFPSWPTRFDAGLDEHPQSSTDPHRARIARRPIPPEKQAQLASALAAELDEFYRDTVLPSFDSMAERQRSQLENLGVPGLGGDPGDPKVRKRVRGIMDVLQGAMDD